MNSDSWRKVSLLIAVLSELYQEMCPSPFGAGRPSLAEGWRECCCWPK